MKTRKILVEITVDWEDYEDVSDDLIIEDAISTESLKKGVSIKVVPDKSEKLLASMKKSIGELKKQKFAAAFVTIGNAIKKYS